MRSKRKIAGTHSEGIRPLTWQAVYAVPCCAQFTEPAVSRLGKKYAALSAMRHLSGKDTANGMDTTALIQPNRNFSYAENALPDLSLSGTKQEPEFRTEHVPPIPKNKPRTKTQMPAIPRTVTAGSRRTVAVEADRSCK